MQNVLIYIFTVYKLFKKSNSYTLDTISSCNSIFKTLEEYGPMSNTVSWIQNKSKTCKKPTHFWSYSHFTCALGKPTVFQTQCLKWDNISCITLQTNSCKKSRCNGKEIAHFIVFKDTLHCVQRHTSQNVSFANF